MKMKFSRAIYAFISLCCVIFFFNPEGFAIKYYSYQSGTWNGSNVWTTDSTGTTLVNTNTPAIGDIVCILTGRTISVTNNISTTGHTITINVGAVLDMTNRTITPITLNGKGLIRTSLITSNVAKLPTVLGGNFLSIGGGTVEYYSNASSCYIDDNIATYCNLILNMSSATQIMVIRRNLIMYGSVNVLRGVFQINDASTTKRTISIWGNLTVDANGKITVSTGNTNTNGYSVNGTLPPDGQFHSIFHQLVINGDFINNGTARFTNLTAPNYGEFPSNGAVTVRFTGESNNTMTLNGVTDFYNLIIDKGSDQTYILTVYSSAQTNFALYGTNAVKRVYTGSFSLDNPEVRKALWIKNGTLKLTGVIVIPSLAEGPVGPADQNGDYAIGLSAQLWLAGPDVAVYTTASDNSGFPQAPANSVGVNTNAEQALSIFGTFRITDGYFSTRHSAGIIFWNTANSSSMVIVEGGILNATVMRSTWTASGKTSYVQTGGTVIVRGNETEAGEMSTVPIFNIPNPSSTFIMTGGEIIIRDKCNGTGVEGNGLYLNCDPGNFSVTGGKIIFETNPVNTPSIDLYSRVTLWNLEVKRLGSSGNSTVNLLYDLTASNKINIFENATLSAGAGNFDVTISDDFLINSGGTYTPNNNTTTFTGYGNYFLWNFGTITNGLYNLQVNKPLGSLILASSSSSFTVRNNLMITNGILADGGKTINVYGNVINNGTHIGAGRVAMVSSTQAQTITGNGLGFFQNLQINNTYGANGSSQVSLGADIGVTGVLNLTNDRLFNISKYTLTLNALASIEGAMSNSRFILTSGAPSDGGLRRVYADTTSYTFPVGCGTSYMPAVVHLTKKPATYGSITVKPVPVAHPFVTNATCVPWYWKVEESGFTTIPANSISLLFNYGALPDNVLYVPGKYNPAFWTYLNDVSLVNEATNTIRFPAESSFTGDYTAGIPGAFGAVTAFYSRQSGEWSTPATWSTAGYGGAAALTAPGAGNPVFIGDGVTYNHTITVSSGSAFSGSLSIKQNSTLDIGTTSGHNFGAVIPASYGKLRISSTGATALFPAGDFGNFLGANGGTVEYYTGTVDFTLPLTSSAPTSRAISNYFNLLLNPGAGRTINMPNADQVIYSTMTVNGGATGLVKLNGTVARSLYIKLDLVVNAGNLIMQHGTPQSIRIDRNLSIAAGAIFNLATTGTVVNHALSIGGSVVNEGTLDLSNLVSTNTYKCDVTFTGSQAASISGRGATTDFYSLTLDKGTSATPVLNITSTAFTFTNNLAPLTLVNGTFRLSTNALYVTVAQQKFPIPPSTCLSANGGFIQVAMTADDEADVMLAGMIEVKLGGIIVGNVNDVINNDIEYSGAGYPTIEVSGGSLFVNGQVRRSMINGLGSLIYKQSGSSTVTINGRNAQPTRAKLEVLNLGSTFNMSGGTLTIVRGASTTYNDLYLRPEKSTVTGGTVVFGSTATETTNNLNKLTIDTQVPLYNLTVDGTTNSKTLTLSVHGITLKGTLTVQATSVFNADSLDVNIAGSLVNLNADAGTGVTTGGYKTGSLRQVTTFNGTAATQNITGATSNITNFAKVVIINTNAAGTVTLGANTAMRVNSDLILTSGTLNDGGNIITVIGNIINNSTHTGTGRILLAGTTVQVLSGNGTGKFGNLYLNSTKDVTMTTTMNITGVLTLQGKMLDIGNNLLILSNTGNGAVAGNSGTSYIRTDGLTSDAGIRKSYPATASDFTFPVGCQLKYTPARINVTTNSAEGTITVIPVNTKHYCTTNAGEFQLKYYWHVTSTGFSGLQVSHYYNYLLADVVPVGGEANYVSARYNNNLWTTGAAVNTTLHQFTFLNANFLDGDFTAGYPNEFLSISTYYSRNATLGGNWNNVNTWSTVSHSGPAATTFPDGQVVVIASGHTVTANGNLRRAYTLTLNGTALLDLSNWVGHDFGLVTGTGTIKLAPSAYFYYVFPAGDYNLFTSASGGGIELTNPSGTAVFPYLQTYNRLILSGAGVKLMADVDILLNGSLTNQSASIFTASTIGKLTINGDWINDGVFNHNNGTTVFNGSTTLSGSVPVTFFKGQINQAASLTGPLSGSFGFAGDWINNGTFNHNSGTVTFSGATTLSGSATTIFNHIQINSGKTFTGKSAANFNMLANWVNNGTFIHNGGGTVFDGASLISGSQTSKFGSVIINATHSLTGPSSDTMCVALNFTNNGTFNHNSGTLLFNGAVQVIGGSSPTLFENIVIETGSSTSVTASNQTLRGTLLCNGTLSANKKLTLLSNQTQTALVDGTGEGEITGNLIMQRYLPVGFGYKYFSSPFQAATVGQFGDHMNLNASFPTFYRYDENRFFTGWLTYTNTAGILNPMEGYAVNFGPSFDPDTLDMFGVVNNRNMIPLTLFNSHRPYTTGFNLIGNPYPSPIDWDADQGWVKANIDDAIYYFNAGNTDQYRGTYSSYINGVTSGGSASNIIAAMQGFFIHVSDGSYPVASTLIFTNGIRVNNLSPSFHKKSTRELRPLLRINARNDIEGAYGDPTVIYFSKDASPMFDTHFDALKMMNTEVVVPNFYSVLQDSSRLSVSGIPYPVDSITEVKLGLQTNIDGPVTFQISDVECMPPGLYIYFCDHVTGIKQNISLHPEYTINLTQGFYDNRFSVIFSLKDLRYQPRNDEMFYIYSFRNRLYIYSKLDFGKNADITICNMLGQRLFHQTISVNGYLEMDVNYPTGVYIVCLSSGEAVMNKKVYFYNQ